jgi:6-phosphogluconolactonase (cycloisomerase 2 family)
MNTGPTTRFFLLLLGISFLAAPLDAQHVTRRDSYDGVAVRILQSNNAGDVQHIIDPTINQVVGTIEGCPRPHNLFAHPDGLYIYCTSEATNTVDVFDARTFQLVDQMHLTARPNKAAINKKYRRIYVGIAAAPYVDVFDLDTHEKITSIEVTTGIHNVYSSPDGNWVVAGLNARAEGSIEIIDPRINEVVGSITLEDDQGEPHTVRPMAFMAGDDGSTELLFAHGTGVNGIWVIDWETREKVTMLWPPALPAWMRNADGNQGAPMHGLEVLPDRSQLWASSRLDSRIYGWTLPDLEYIGAIEVGATANWMTSTPDSRYMYVAVSGSDYTIAIDLQTHEIVAKMTTGARPARIDVAVLPFEPAGSASR